MLRRQWTIWLCLSVSVAGLGCANRMEMRAIESFAAALTAEDLDKLKKTTSGDFEEKALRLDESMDDLKVLRLPTGKVEVVKVQDLSETEKIVTAEVGETKRKLRYILVLDEKTRRWVVDDIYVKQKRDGVEATKSVTEQMDLLLSVREFLRAWGSSDREAALAVTTPKFRETLEQLPPAWFAHVTRQVIGDAAKMKKVRPEAQLDDNVAVVRIPRATGQIMMTLDLQDNRWQVSDLAVEAKGDREQIPSVQKHTIALTTAIRFLQAYAEEDRETLEKVCAEKFYAGGIAPADLKSIALPAGDAPLPDHQFHIIAKRAEMILPTERELVKVSMFREEATDADTLVTYKVEDVTLYELDGSQEKRLSSMFTAHAMLQVFSEALQRRDLSILRKTSTADFNRRVWDRLKQQGKLGTVAMASASSHTTIDDLPLGEIPPEMPKVVKTSFQGAVTEITAEQGDKELTYILREHSGEVRVDDIHLKESNLPRSLKETAELIIPLREFTAGLQLREMNLIQRNSSKDYNRLVWTQTDRMPELTAQALKHLRMQVTGIQAKPDEVLLTLGDEDWGARVLLVKEYSQLVVDDVMLVQGLEAAQRPRLKQAMRLELASGARTPSGLDERVVLRPGAVVAANFEEFQEAPEERLKPAGHDVEPVDDPDLMPPDPADDAFETPPPLLPDVEGNP